MKIGIVIPLKSVVVSRDWANTCRMLERTLASVAGQTSPHWAAVVVGHERPEGIGLIDSGRIPFESVDLALPPLAIGGDYTRYRDFNRILDKRQKLLRGMQFLAGSGITHWFVLDADDLLHYSFVETLVSRDGFGDEGVILESGWIYHPDSRRRISCDELAQICGSTTVLPARLVKVPEYPSLDASGNPWWHHSHSGMEDFLRQQRGVRVFKPDRRLVCYVMGHGDNCSDEFRSGLVNKCRQWLKLKLRSRSCDASFRRGFSLPD
jgi:hypothetical protein